MNAAWCAESHPIGDEALAELIGVHIQRPALAAALEPARDLAGVAASVSVSSPAGSRPPGVTTGDDPKAAPTGA